MSRPRKAATTRLGEHLDKAAARLGGLKQLQAALADAGAAVTLRTIHGWRFGEYSPDVTQYEGIAKVCGLSVEQIEKMLSESRSQLAEATEIPAEQQPQRISTEIPVICWRLRIEGRYSNCLLACKTSRSDDGSSYDIMLFERSPPRLSFGRAFDAEVPVRFVLYGAHEDKIFIGQPHGENQSRLHGYLIESIPFLGVSLVSWSGQICDLDDVFPNASDLLKKDFRSWLFDLLCEQDLTKPPPQILLDYFEADATELTPYSYFEVDGSTIQIETPATLYSNVVPPKYRIVPVGTQLAGIESEGAQPDVSRKPWWRFGATNKL